jgi:RNA polymerase sigma-70 factor (ECF subfamily)
MKIFIIFQKGAVMDNGASSYLRFLQGDKDAIVEIVSEYNDGLVLFLNSFIGNICLAEEMAEDVFCDLLIEKPKFNGKSSFKTWLYAIARYKALHFLKKRAKAPEVPIDELYSLSDEVDIVRNHVKNEQKIQLHTALKKISPEYSQVLYLIFFEEFSNSETANILKKSNRQIENLLYRAKKSLRSELEKEGFVYEKL